MEKFFIIKVKQIQPKLIHNNSTYRQSSTYVDPCSCRITFKQQPDLNPASSEKLVCGFGIEPGSSTNIIST